MMPAMEPIRLVSPAQEEPPALHERAMDNLSTYARRWNALLPLPGSLVGVR